MMLSLIIFLTFLLSPGIAIAVAFGVLTVVLLLLRLLQRRQSQPTTTIAQYRYCGGQQETARRKRQIDRGILTHTNGLWRSNRGQ